jgi:hypothetical protein
MKRTTTDYHTRHSTAQNIVLIMTFWFALTVAQRVYAQCQYIPATSTSSDVVTYAFSGGTFASYGCEAIDPTYWVSKSTGGTITVTFETPQSNPSVRVWGMNDDDTAVVSVNGSYYQLTQSSASYGRKVVCGLSPGSGGIAFTNGGLVGVNSNHEGNYSYQDLTIVKSDVTEIVITVVSGNGWGFAGVSVGCLEATDPSVTKQSDSDNPKPKK